MLHLLDQLDPSDPALRDALADHARTVAAPRGRGDVSLVARVEAEVKADPARHLRFDETGRATLHAAGRTFQAGLFETPRLGELRRRTEEARVLAGHPAARLRLFVLDGTDPATDVGALQAHAPAGTLFQVASQFNCLEAEGARGRARP